MSDTSAVLGALLRELRRAQGLTLVQLAARSGLSHPFLSQVENGRARPSFTSLSAIAAALGSSQFEIFSEIARRQPVEVTPADPAVASVTESYADGTARVFAGDFQNFTPVEVYVEAGDFGEYYSHAEEEFCYLLEGQVVADLGGEMHVMSAGAAVHVPGLVPHRWRSANGAPFRLLFVKGRSRGPQAPQESAE